MSAVPDDASGLRLYRIDRKGRLHGCEIVQFAAGRDAVDTILRRAAISGRVEVGGEIQDHFADILDASHSMIETVALDAQSYHKLKTKWMPCRVEKEPA